MEEEAIQLYKLCTTVEFKIGSISIYELYLRLITLYNLSNNSENVRIYISELFEQPDLENTNYTEEPEYKATSGENEGNASTGADPTLYFLTPKAGKVSVWKFTIGDPDFFPSIPHGHSIKSKTVKLDSYLGYFYDVRNRNSKSLPIGRETRQYIIDLWNNPKFRAFASDHINWYLSTYPNHVWRVPKHRIKTIPKTRP